MLSWDGIPGCSEALENVPVYCSRVSYRDAGSMATRDQQHPSHDHIKRPRVLFASVSVHLNTLFFFFLPLSRHSQIGLLQY